MDVKCCETCFVSQKISNTGQLRRIRSSIYISSEVFLEENFRIAQVKPFNYNSHTLTDFNSLDGLRSMPSPCITEAESQHTHIPHCKRKVRIIIWA